MRISGFEMKGRQNEARKVFGPSGGTADVDSIPPAALIAVMHWNGNVTVTIGKESIGWARSGHGLMPIKDELNIGWVLGYPYKSMREHIDPLSRICALSYTEKSGHSWPRYHRDNMILYIQKLILHTGPLIVLGLHLKNPCSCQLFRLYQFHLDMAMGPHTPIIFNTELQMVYLASP